MIRANNLQLPFQSAETVCPGRVRPPSHPNTSPWWEWPPRPPLLHPLGCLSRIPTSRPPMDLQRLPSGTLLASVRRFDPVFQMLTRSNLSYRAQSGHQRHTRLPLMFISAASHLNQPDYPSVLTGSRPLTAKWRRLGENSDLQRNALLIRARSPDGRPRRDCEPS